MWCRLPVGHSQRFGLKREWVEGTQTGDRLLCSSICRRWIEPVPGSIEFSHNAARPDTGRLKLVADRYTAVHTMFREDPFCHFGHCVACVGGRY